MRLNPAFAEDFARAWVQAWNDRDLEAILSHYADTIVFHSPRIDLVLRNGAAKVDGKDALRAYWGAALERSPTLYFELDDVLIGSDAMTVFYTNHRDERVAETFVFDETGAVILSIATYG
jgi:ketosteroid isomerase-like protein